MKVIYEKTTSPEYTGVFVIETPVFDHSGLCHLIEHMVFRGSKKYPASHELFLINHLLPAKINASTQNGFTFFFVNCQSLALFTLLLDYIYQGLIQTDYDQNEFILERDGVIARELALYESDPNYALHCAILRGDTSENAIKHYGGFSDTINENTLQELTKYKRFYYHPEKIQLLLSAPVEEAEILDSLERVAVDEVPVPCAPIHMGGAITHQQDIQPESVVTWWIEAGFISQIQQNKCIFDSELDSQTEKLVIESELNSKGLCAIRIVTLDAAKTIDKITPLIKQLPTTKHTANIENNKYPNAVKNLIEKYHNLQISTDENPEKPKTIIHRIEKSQLVHLKHLPAIKLERRAKFEDSKIAKACLEHLNVSNLPVLPKLFHSFTKRFSKNNHFVFEGNHWLYKITSVQKDSLRSLIINPKFWAPRLQGECYAMGIAKMGEDHFLYGAEDIFVSCRLAWCEKWFQGRT